MFQTLEILNVRIQKCTFIPLYDHVPQCCGLGSSRDQLRQDPIDGSLRFVGTFSYDMMDRRTQFSLRIESSPSRIISVTLNETPTINIAQCIRYDYTNDQRPCTGVPYKL